MGYGLDYDNNCVKSNTKYCLSVSMDRKTCRECVEGYSLNAEGICIQRECTSKGCVKCIDGKSICDECAEGFYKSETECKKCSSNCRKCDDSTEAKCTYCNYNYGFNGEHKCIKVGGGFCLNADPEGKSCAECIPGYYFDNDKQFCMEGKKGSAGYLKIGFLLLLVLLI